MVRWFSSQLGRLPTAPEQTITPVTPVGAGHDILSILNVLPISTAVHVVVTTVPSFAGLGDVVQLGVLGAILSIVIVKDDECPDAVSNNGCSV